MTVSNDPYAAPSANLDTESAPIPTSIWSARGRLGVLSYFAQSLLFTLVAAIIMIAVIALVGMVSGGSMESMAAGGEPPIAAILVGIPLFLIMMYVVVCMLIKRLHDRNHSGWWSLIMLIPFVSLLLYLYLLVPGSKTSNRFGAPRVTKGWEKVLGIIAIIVMVGSIVLGVLGVVAGIAGT